MTNTSNSSESPLSHRYCPEGMSLDDWQATLRKQIAYEHPFEVFHADSNRIWGDYVVQSGNNRYRVAFRGVRSEKNFCTCLDFRTNGLGTCKHIESVIRFLRLSVPGYPWSEFPYLPPHSSLYISYGTQREIKISIGSEAHEEFEEWKEKYFDENNRLHVEHYAEIDKIYQEGQSIHTSFRCYDDVFEMAQEISRKRDWSRTIGEIAPQEIFQKTPFESLLGSESLETIYPIIQKGYGLLLYPNSPIMLPLILGLVFISQRFSASRSLIIAASAESAEEWRKNWRCFASSHYNIEIITESELASYSQPSSALSARVSYGTVFVENGVLLKEWSHPLSLFIKKNKIEHLYIHLDSLSRFTPVQLSSIIQHISPYLLGPLHLFIHKYQALFPLGNEVDAWPQEIQEQVFSISESEVQYSSQFYSPNIQNKVDLWFQLLYEIMQDPQERETLQRNLHKILQQDKRL